MQPPVGSSSVLMQRSVRTNEKGSSRAVIAAEILVKLAAMQRALRSERLRGLRPQSPLTPRASADTRSPCLFAVRPSHAPGKAVAHHDVITLPGDGRSPAHAPKRP